MTYGHMTLAEWERRGGERNLALEERGVWYRITDFHVVRNLDVPRVNYQAVEMTDHEVRAMKAEMTEVPGKGVVVHAPEVRATASGKTEEEARENLDSLLAKYPEALESVEPDRFEWPATGRKPSNPKYKMVTDEHPEGIPALSVWAKTHGWKGIGAIPNAVKVAYSEEFGIPKAQKR